MKTIGVFFGSRSPEHDISIITALRVLEGFRGLPRYRGVPVYIAKDGSWYAGEALGEIGFFRDLYLAERLEPYGLAAISFGRGEFVLHPRRRGFLARTEPIRLEAAFPCFHGGLGEDGAIQGLFEIAGIPYVGCGVLASAIAMSKVHTRSLLREAGIPVVPTAEVRREAFERSRDEALARVARALPYPLFVKPNGLGSSIAVTRVANERELGWALELALQFDRLALVEQAVTPVREVNVAIIGHREPVVSETEAPTFRSAFQTFEEKYVIKGGTIGQSKGTGKSQIPADLPPGLGDRLKETARRAWRLIAASGIARFDFLVNTATWQWYLGEVNTLPGALQAHLWEASGVPLPVLIEKLLSYAEERHRESEGLIRTFESSLLQQK